MSARGLEAIDRIVNDGGDADDVLRAVVSALASEPGIDWAGVLFLESGALALGPVAGTADQARRLQVPVSYQGTQVGQLAVDGVADTAFLDGVATLISAHVLLGWDIGGEVWEP